MWLARAAGGAFAPALAEVGALPRERVGFLCADPGALPIEASTFAALSIDG